MKKKSAILSQAIFVLFMVLCCVNPLFAQDVPMPTGIQCMSCGKTFPYSMLYQHKCESDGANTRTGPNTGEQRRNKAKTFISKANDNYKKGDYKKAIAYYRKAYWYDPNDESLLRKIKELKEKNVRVTTSKPSPKPKPIKPTKPEPVNNNNAVSSEIRKQVEKTIFEDKKKYKSQLERLEAIKSVVPPLGFNKRKTVEDGFMLGLFNEESVYLQDTSLLKSPFSGKAYHEGEFFAGTDKVTAFELYRGLRDSWQIGNYTLSTEYGQNLVRRINGTHFKKLIAHSNGATITEALIRAEHIKVDELNIIGGDRSLMNNDGYDELIKKHGVKKIVVWINPSDLVPDGSSALKLIKSGISYNKEYEKAFLDYVNNSLIAGKKQNPNVEYRILSGPEYPCGQRYLSPLDAHGFDCYMKNMKVYWSRHGK
ncbi:MAG: tetratricopeptide repeat protein [Chitinophagaceae bacterium]|nr:tetratricopeptide repeat protein [Chitinophagaceae bacterium]